jgi:hypothetical protein
MVNVEVALTLDDAVADVLGQLVGLDLPYVPEQDRYYAVTRQINRALRAVALEAEWSYYSDVEEVGYAHEGDRIVPLRESIRPRIINDDAVRLVNDAGAAVVWAYFLPRDALSKYAAVPELKCAHTRSTLEFSRAFYASEEGLRIQVPIMREPRMFRLPERPENPADPIITVPDDVREQYVDFDYPDLVVMKAAWFYAQSNPLWQPRVQTLEATYKDMMYALTERDSRNTDTPYQNEWDLGIDSGIRPARVYSGRPTANFDKRRYN